MRLFGLPKGPSTLRLQDLLGSPVTSFPRIWKWGFRRKFAKRLARTLVIQLDIDDDESHWKTCWYPELLQLLKAEKILSLTFANGRFPYSYKEADPLHDGIMGWIPASREKCVGPELAMSIKETGLPATLTELEIQDAGIDADATTSLLSALPPGLERLDLTHNDIGEDGLRALGTAALPALTGLRFGWKGFGDAHAAAFVKAVGAKGGESRFPSLARLRITTGPLSKLSRQRLSERFGNVLQLVP
jgi:predicted protein tyrosine phosphatase